MFRGHGTPLHGFHVNGHLAMSRLEVMGDPCQILPEKLYDQWCNFALRHSREWTHGHWHSTWFANVPMRVVFTGSDGLWWGCSIDTATVIRLLRSDWEILKENY